MIVAETAAGYQFVTQPDHAALAGQFADHWGREEFDRPEPFAPVVLAAYAHDDGWRDYDRRPHLDGAGHPVDFRDMPPDVWTDLYDDGIDAVAETDTYAGLLVSMHGAGLRNQRYGLSPAGRRRRLSSRASSSASIEGRADSRTYWWTRLTGRS